MNAKTPLQYVTDELANGRRAELARLLGLSRSTITGWNNPQRRACGMVGTVPLDYVPKLQAIAAAAGKSLDLARLMPQAQR